MDSRSVSTMWKPNVLTIGPGGMKGFKYLGTLWALETAELLDQLEIIQGVSVGAFIATLWLAGYKVPEIFHIAAESGIFHDVESIDIRRVISKQGAVDPEHLIKLINGKMIEKYGFVPTMRKFYLLTGVKLEITSSNLCYVDEECLTYETAPDLSVVEACLYSAGLPFIFERMYYKGCSMIDGGFSNPYPVDKYDKPGYRVLGIALETEFDSDPGDNIVGYVYRILNQPVTMLRRKIIATSSDRCRHILLYSKETDITGLSMSIDTKKQMLLSGWSSTVTIIKRWKAGIESIEIPEDGEVPVVSEDEVFDELVANSEDPLEVTLEELDESHAEDTEKYIYIRLSDRTAQKLDLSGS